MFKIIFIENNKEIISLVKQNLEYEIKCEIEVCENITQISSALRIDPRPHLIVCREPEEDKNLPLKIGTALIREGIDIPSIIFAKEDPKLNTQYSFYPIDSYTGANIIEVVLKSLDPNKENRIEDIPDYVPFPMHYFFNLSSFESDIFIKLKKRDQDQYVKRINALEEFDKASLLKYKQSGMEELYIPKEFRFKFVDAAVNQTIQKIKDAHKLEVGDKGLDANKITEIGNDSYDLSTDMIDSLGISPQTVKITQASILHIKKAVLGIKSLAPLLESLLSNKTSYAYKRCQLITMFSLEVLKRVDWFSKDQLKENFNRLAFASFLHDILLKDEKLLRIHSKLDLYKAGNNLTKEEKELIFNHANATATLIQKYPGAPQHADIVIKQHHGTTNGQGFAENLNSSLSKNAIIFIVVEKFVIEILDFKKGETTLVKILDDLEHEFSLPTYKKVVDAIKETILKEARSR